MLPDAWYTLLQLPLGVRRGQLRIYSSLTRKLRQVFYQLWTELPDNALGTVHMPTSSKPNDWSKPARYGERKSTYITGCIMTERQILHWASREIVDFNYQPNVRHGGIHKDEKTLTVLTSISLSEERSRASLVRSFSCMISCTIYKQVNMQDHTRKKTLAFLNCSRHWASDTSDCIPLVLGCVAVPTRADTVARLSDLIELTLVVKVGNRGAGRRGESRPYVYSIVWRLALILDPDWVALPMKTRPVDGGKWRREWRMLAVKSVLAPYINLIYPNCLESRG